LGTSTADDAIPEFLVYGPESVWDDDPLEGEPDWKEERREELVPACEDVLVLPVDAELDDSVHMEGLSVFFASLGDVRGAVVKM
jgi:hypothetical protein